MCDVCGRCYMFELVADDFRRIVRYEAPRIVLHGVRDITTLLEEDPGVYAVRRLAVDVCEGYGSSMTRKQSQNGWECAREFPHLTTHEEILSATKGLNPWQQVRKSFVAVYFQFAVCLPKSRPALSCVMHWAIGSSTSRPSTWPSSSPWAGKTKVRPDPNSLSLSLFCHTTHMTHLHRTRHDS